MFYHCIRQRLLGIGIDYFYGFGLNIFFQRDYNGFAHLIDSGFHGFGDVAGLRRFKVDCIAIIDFYLYLAIVVRSVILAIEFHFCARYGLLSFGVNYFYDFVITDFAERNSYHIVGNIGNFALKIATYIAFF